MPKGKPETQAEEPAPGPEASKGKESTTSLFGTHAIPVKLAEEGVTISVEQAEDTRLYRRELGEETVEKLLLSDRDEILITPVEPVNRPKKLSPYFLVELERPVMVEPKTTRKIYLSFPVEVGVFVSGEEDVKRLDIFTLARQKFTLYADMERSIICRYWKSDVFTSPPSLHPLYEGIMELTITNNDDSWFELVKVVFNVNRMRIFYTDSLVSVKAALKITKAGTVETEFVDSPLEEDMKRAVKLTTTRTPAMLSKGFIMERRGP